jgi:hypothetical protein
LFLGGEIPIPPGDEARNIPKPCSLYKWVIADTQIHVQVWVSKHMVCEFGPAMVKHVNGFFEVFLKKRHYFILKTYSVAGKLIYTNRWEIRKNIPSSSIFFTYKD